MMLQDASCFLTGQLALAPLPQRSRGRRKATVNNIKKTKGCMKPTELNKDASVRLVPVAMLSEFAVCLGNVRSYRHGTLGNEKKGNCYKFTSQAKGCGSVRFTVTQVGSALYIFQKVISVPQRTNMNKLCQEVSWFVFSHQCLRHLHGVLGLCVVQQVARPQLDIETPLVPKLSPLAFLRS